MTESPPDIPPAGIRMIREYRGETQEEFGERLGVTHTSIGYWERGDKRPQSDSRKDLIDAIPEGLALEEVLEASDRLDDEPRAFDNEKRLFGSDRLQELRDRPRIAEEIGGGGGLGAYTDRQRMFVQRLTVTGVEGGGQRDGERVKTVYYLQGDERRALRRFIEENETVVREQLQDNPNRFSTEWDEFLYGLLEEEFRFWLHG